MSILDTGALRRHGQQLVAAAELAEWLVAVDTDYDDDDLANAVERFAEAAGLCSYGLVPLLVGQYDMLHDMVVNALEDEATRP